METFLLTYQSFTTAQELLEKLMERYFIPWNSASTWKEYESIRNISQLRVCNIFITWTKKYTSDFLWKNSDDEKVDRKNIRMSAIGPINQKKSASPNFIQKLMEFVETVLAQDHPKMARQIRRNVVRLMNQKMKELPFSTFRVLHPEDSMPESREAILLQDNQEIARHLTHTEFILFSKVLPLELLDQAWTKADAAVRARNIFAITRRFNSVACWVCQSVVEGKDAKSRARVYSRFIEIAEVCLLSAD